MTTKKEIGEQFVQAYYTTLIQNRNDLTKFYDKEAMIWRDSFGNGEGKNFESAKPDLFVKISHGCDVSVTGYSFNNFHGGIHVFVNGHILDNDLVYVFVQSFVILEKSERYFIVSDTLKINETEKIVDSETETYVVRHQRRQQQKSKFGPYIPGND